MDLAHDTYTLNVFENSQRWFGVSHTTELYKNCLNRCIFCKRNYPSTFQQPDGTKEGLIIFKRQIKERILHKSPETIGFGLFSDPYNPFEEKLKLTKNVLDEVSKNKLGVCVTTKYSLVKRDIDVFKEISKHSPAFLNVSMSTINEGLRRKIENNYNTVGEKLSTIEFFSRSNVIVGGIMGPILPYITDNPKEIEILVTELAQRGAKYILPQFSFTLEKNRKQYFFQKLMEEFPERSLLIRYKNLYGQNNSAQLENLEEIEYIFKDQCEKLGILYNMEQIINYLHAPYYKNQLSFFDEAN